MRFPPRTIARFGFAKSAPGSAATRASLARAEVPRCRGRPISDLLAPSWPGSFRLVSLTLEESNPLRGELYGA